MDESIPRIDQFIRGMKKLEGASNYLVWAYRVKQLFKFDEAWSVVERQIPIDRNGSDARQIQEMKNRAMYIFAFTLGDPVIMFIRNLRDPAEVWAKLKTRFEARSRMMLRQSSETFAMLPVLSSPDASDDQEESGSTVLNIPGSDLNSSNPAAQAEQIEIQKKKNLAMAILVESVEDHIVPLIMDLDDPAEVWARLKFLFEVPSVRLPPTSAAAAA